MWTYGVDGFFRTDLSIALSGLDEQGLLEQKESPVRLNGRRQAGMYLEGLWRTVEAEMAACKREPVILDVIDRQPDVVAEHLAAKERCREHYAAGRYQKVRRSGKPESSRAFKNIDRRRMRRALNNAVRFGFEADHVGKHGAEYAAETGKVSFRYGYLD